MDYNFISIRLNFLSDREDFRNKMSCKAGECIGALILKYNGKTCTDLALYELIDKKEAMDLNFFQECISKTNQFSAQYILMRVLQNHKNHISELQQAVGDLPMELISSQVINIMEEKFSCSDLCREFDLSTLTMDEATKIVIRVAERSLDFYRNFLGENLSTSAQKSLKKIIIRKTAYIEHLKNEQSRLRQDVNS
jgi:hypothetical protein